MAAEAALVLLGAWAFARATRSPPDRRGLGRMMAALTLVGGLGTLLLDVTGVAG